MDNKMFFLEPVLVVHMCALLASWTSFGFMDRLGKEKGSAAYAVLNFFNRLIK